MKLLLCVDDSGLHARSPIKRGRVYTLASRIACACGRAYVGVQESRWPKNWTHRHGCKTCGVILARPGDPRCYLPNRFVEINDPDAATETKEKELVHI